MPGSYSTGEGSNSESVCALCTFGKFATGKGFISDQNCTNCTAGAYSTGEGMPSPDSCVTCQQGTYQESRGAVGCISCPKGTYGPYAGATSASQCTFCPLGSYSINESSTLLSQCLCQKGFYEPIAGGGRACSQCPLSSYSNVVGSRSCTICPANTYDANPDLSTTRDDIISVCSAMPDDFSYAPEGSTTYFCNAGYYKNPPYSCEYCPVGSYSYKNTTECSECLHGTTDAIASPSISSCRCNAGFYKPTNMSECVVCPVDSFCVGGKEDSQPDLCSTGRKTVYDGAMTAAECICQRGWYGNADDVACTTCGIGSWCPGMHHHYTHHLFLQFVLENAMFLAFIYFCNLF